MKAVGIVLIVLGLVGLVYGGIRWTEKDKVVDIGPVEVTRTEHKSIPLPPRLRWPRRCRRAITAIARAPCRR